MESKKVKVEIFSQKYTINGDTSEEYIRKLASYIDDKMNEVSENASIANPLQVAILVALNISDEYFQIKEILMGTESKIEEKTKAMISLIDEGLIGDIFSRIESIEG